MSDSNRVELVFRGGTSGADCEDFITAVNQWAFEEEKQENDRQVAQFAYSRMAGEAVRFYDTLDVEVQGSWRQLRQALLAAYSPHDRTVPSPPTARSSDSGNARVGVIRLTTEGEANPRYLCHPPGDTHGEFTALEDIRKALYVKLDVDASGGIRPIRLVSTVGWLGLAWYNPDARRAIEREAHANFTCINESATSSCNKFSGPTAWVIWKYHQSTGRLEAQWYEDEGLQITANPMSIRFHPTLNVLRLGDHLSIHGAYKVVELTFVPV